MSEWGGFGGRERMRTAFVGILKEKYNNYPELKKQTLPQIYPRTLADWRTVFHLFTSFYLQWNHGISAVVQFSLFTGFISEYFNPGVEMSASPCLSVCLSVVHRDLCVVRQTDLSSQIKHFGASADSLSTLTSDLNRSSEPSLLLNEHIVPSGSSGFRLISVRTGASGVDVCTSCSRKLLTVLLTPPQWHLHTFHRNTQANFKSWDVLTLTATITE